MLPACHWVAEAKQDRNVNGIIEFIVANYCYSTYTLKEAWTISPDGRKSAIYWDRLLLSNREGINMPVNSAPSSSSLAEIVNSILDKGIVIDAWVRISLVGIEILTIEARAVVASVETYLKYAEAIGLTATAAPS
jgi:hypothetical protein